MNYELSYNDNENILIIIFIKYITVLCFIIVYYSEIKELSSYKTVIKRKKFNRFKNINNNLFNLEYLYNLKKLVFSVNLGGYDDIKPLEKKRGYDYFLFVDKFDNSYNNSNWTIIFLPEIVRNLNISLIKQQRFIKTHPHIFFPNYDISIYVDCTYKIFGNLDEFLLRILTPRHSIYILEHPERNKIADEFEPIQILKKDNVSILLKVNPGSARICD